MLARWSYCLKTWPGESASQFPDHTCSRRKGHEPPCRCSCKAERPVEPKPYKYTPGQKPDDD